MEKSEMINNHPLLIWIGVLQLISLILFSISPFIWIWISWVIAWKLALSGLLGMILMYGLYTLVKNIIKEGIAKQ